MNEQILTTVESILTKYPETRDDNSKLCFMYYSSIDPLFFVKHEGVDNKKYDAIDVLTFFKNLSKKRYPAMSSITRASRKVQEKFESLRGKNWKKRQRHQKIIVETVGKWEGKRRHEVNLIHHDNKLPRRTNENIG